ncbi:hypothetical protein ACKWTF_015509 [Chironomus riparius]
MFEKLLKAENIFESSKFLIILNKICFLLFISIETSSNGKFKATTKPRDFTIFIIFLIFGTYSIVNLFTSETNIDTTRSIVSQIAIYFKIRIQLFQTVIATVVAFVKRKNYFEILTKFNAIDLKLLSFGVIRNYKQDLKFTIYFIASIFIIFDIITISGLIPIQLYNVHYLIPYKNLFFILSFQIAAVTNLTFTISMMAVNSRVLQTLKAIKSIEHLSCNDIKLLMRIYSNFFDISNLCNDFFSQNILIGFAEYFLQGIVTAFLTYELFFVRSSFDYLMLFFSSFAYFIATSIIYFLVLKTSSNLKSNGNKMWKEINKRRNSDENVQNLCEISILQMRSQQLVAGCKIFQFDWKVLFLIFTGVVSYLTIMIQFDISVGDLKN